MRSGDSNFPVSWNTMSLFGLILNYTDAPNNHQQRGAMFFKSMSPGPLKKYACNF